MYINFKKILLTGTALVAVAAFATQAQAATVTVNGANVAVAADPAATPAITFQTDNTATVNSGITLSTAGDTVTTSTTNTGTLTLAGGVQEVNGAVGVNGGNVLKLVNAGANGAASTFDVTVDATTVDLTGTGSITATGAVTATNLNLNGAGTVTLNAAANNAITNTVYNADATLAIGTGGTLTSTVTTATTNTGTLTLAGNGTVTGTVGTAAKQLKVVNAGAAGDTVTFSGAVNATTLNVTGAAGVVDLNGAALNTIGTTNFAADGTVSLATGGTLTGNVATATTNTGTLTLAGTETITGNVGATGLLLKQFNVGNGAETITGNVFATTTTLQGNNTVTFGGNVTGTTLDFGATTGTATIASGKNLTAAVSGTAASTLSFLGGTQSDTGIINNNLMIINGGATGGATTFNSAVTAATINVTGTGTEEFKGNTAGNLVFAAQGTATVDAGDSFTGSLNGTGGVVGTGIGNVVFSGASSAITTIGDTGILKSLTLNGTGATVSTTGNVLAADTTNVKTNTLSVTGTFGSGAAQTLSFTASGAGAAGQITATGAATVPATSVINLTGVSAAGTYLLVSGTGGSVTAANMGDLKVNGVADPNANGAAFTAGLMSFNEVVNAVGGDSLQIVAVRNAVSSVAGLTANDLAVGNALVTIGGTGGATLNAVQAKLNSAGSAAAVHADYQSLTPTVDGGAENVAFDLGQETQDIFDTRLASLRNGDATSGVAAGATTQGVGVWFEGYGQHANQHTRDSIDGYSSNTGGGAIGADSKSLGDDTVVGFALNYGLSTIDSKNANTTKTDVDSYGLNFYGTYTLPDRMFINGQAGYTYNKVSSDRHNADLAGNTAHGTTHSDQYSVKADTGRDYPFADAAGLILTPTVFTDYTYLKTLGYTESGAGGADLAVGGQSVSAWDLGVGVNAGWKIKANDGDVVKPGIHAKYGYDLLNDKVQTSSSFTGDPASTVFITSGAKPARSTYDLGASIVYATTADWDFSANYDFKYKQDFRSSTGEIRATVHF